MAWIERERGLTRSCSQCGESQVPSASEVNKAACSVTKGLLKMSNLGPNSRNRGLGGVHRNGQTKLGQGQATLKQTRTTMRTW